MQNKGNDYSWVNWTPKDLKQKAIEAVQIYKDAVMIIAEIPLEKVNFKNVLGAAQVALALATDNLSQISFLQQVSTSKEIRDTAMQETTAALQIIRDINDHTNFFLRIKKLYTKRKKLSKEEEKLATDFYKYYVHLGLDLPIEKRKKAVILDKEIQKLAAVFDQKIAEDQPEMLVKKGNVSGIPDSVLSTLKKDAKGNYYISTRYPELRPALTYATNPEVRRKLVLLNYSRGGKKNLELLTKIVQLRKTRAALSGHTSFQSFIADDTAAKTEKNIKNFTKALESILPYAKLQYGELKKEKKNTGDTTPFNFADTLFYQEIKRKKEFSLDMEKVREFFPADHVLTELFAFYKELFGVTFIKKEKRLWHKDVFFYEVYKNKEHIGDVALDLFPREGKFSHAAMFGIQVPHALSGIRRPAVIGLLMNFRAPNGSIPSLLNFDELETLIHETGHMMHELLSRARFFSQCGTNTARDFVELPSQFMEKFFTIPTMIQRFSSHYRTKEKISNHDAEILAKKDSFLKALEISRILSSVLFDNGIHSSIPPRNINTFYLKVFKRVTGLTLPEQTMFPAAFGHMVHGYEGQYYSYLWADTYVSEVWQQFGTNPKKWPAVAKRYEKEILSVGSSRPEALSVRKFLGRAPSPKAFIAEVTGKKNKK